LYHHLPADSFDVLGTPNGRPERACGFAAGAVSTLWLKIVVSMQIMDFQGKEAPIRRSCLELDCINLQTVYMRRTAFIPLALRMAVLRELVGLLQVLFQRCG
jgi:hypothetical protein